jgi:biotin carboxylase
MEKKIIDLNKSVYELYSENPEVIEILATVGFAEITKNPAMLATAGRIMTIPKASKKKNVPLETIKQAFIDKGYEIVE